MLNRVHVPLYDGFSALPPCTGGPLGPRVRSAYPVFSQAWFLERPRVLLAPRDELDPAFRALAVSRGCDLAFVGPLDAATAATLVDLAEERPIGVTLAPADAGSLLRAAESLKKAGADVLELPDAEALSAVHAVVDLPICTRGRGIGRGAAAVITGPDERPAAARSNVPVIVELAGEGSPAELVEAFRRSGARALRLGAGAVGNPWLSGRVVEVLSGREDPGPPPEEELWAAMSLHFDALVRLCGEEATARFAPHAAGYLRERPQGSLLPFPAEEGATAARDWLRHRAVHGAGG